MIQQALSWLGAHWIEIFGALTGFIYVFLEIKQNMWLWPVGILTSAFYIVVFLTSKFYADMGLQVYYLIISVYGWFYWMRGTKAQEAPEHLLPISHISWRLGFKLLLVSALLMGGIAQVLIHFTDSPLPWWDAFTTALSIVATWMLARKILEHWVLWVIIDMVSAGLYLYKGLRVTFILFIFYTVMAIIGYLEWTGTLKKKVHPSLLDAI